MRSSDNTRKKPLLCLTSPRSSLLVIFWIIIILPKRKMTGETPEVRSDKRRRKLFYVVKGLVQNSAHRMSEAQCKRFRKELLFCFLFCTAVAYFTINYSSELSVAHYSSLHHHPLLSIHQGCTLASAPKTLFSSKILFPPLCSSSFCPAWEVEVAL